MAFTTSIRVRQQARKMEISLTALGEKVNCKIILTILSIMRTGKRRGRSFGAKARLARCISSLRASSRRNHVECDEADADAVMAEVQAIMETRTAQVFNGQKIGVEAHIEIIGAV